MIARIWHGYTTPAHANAYENLLNVEVFASIEAKKLQGYLGIQLLTRNLQDEVEFTTIMWFANLESVKQFTGEDYERAYVPENARLLLSRYDERSIHWAVIQERYYEP